MKEIKFAQEQIKSILAQIAVEEDGYNQVLKLAMEALMQGERMIYNDQVRVMGVLFPQDVWSG